MEFVNLVFLADREHASDLGDPHFAFEARPFDPYDAAVPECVERLAAEGKAVIDGGDASCACSAPAGGLARGRAELKRMPRPAPSF